MENDQTIKADAGKLPLADVPTEIIRNIAAIRQFGIGKYGSNENWKQVEVKRYRAAAFRHFLAYLDDPDELDDESGLPALWHLACNIAFLCELEKDRYKSTGEKEKDVWIVRCDSSGKYVKERVHGKVVERKEGDWRDEP